MHVTLPPILPTLVNSLREVPLLRVLLALACLLSLATSAQAERVWMLWVESPAGSDQWSLVPIAKPGFKTEEDCH